MEDRRFEVTGTDHPSGAVTGRCLACGTERTSSPGDVLAWKQNHKCPETVAKAVYAPAEPVERPGGQESTVAPQREQFGDLERSVLDFEDEWVRAHPRTGHANTGPKMAAIVEAFGITSTAYYQLLNRLLDMEEAEQFKPILVHRLRSRRDEARAVRERAAATAREIDERTKGKRQPPREDDVRVTTSRAERCVMLATLLKNAGLDRARTAGPEGDATHVVVSTGLDGDGYYRLIPGVGEAVTIYFVPPTGATLDVGNVLTHARAAGAVLDHIAGVHS